MNSRRSPYTPDELVVDVEAPAVALGPEDESRIEGRVGGGRTEDVLEGAVCGIGGERDLRAHAGPSDWLRGVIADSNSRNHEHRSGEHRHSSEAATPHPAPRRLPAARRRRCDRRACG